MDHMESSSSCRNLRFPHAQIDHMTPIGPSVKTPGILGQQRKARLISPSVSAIVGSSR